jgi:hypothetical protein
VASGLFFDGAPQSGSATAAFVKTDSTTQGTWKGVYGANGSAIDNDSTNYPVYAQVTLNNEFAYTWSASTADVRALQKYAGSDRIASTWYASSSFNIDVNITDGNTHQVAVYCLDWDYGGRSERIDVLDGTNGSVLDSRSVSGFSNGVYLVWTVSGHVNFRVTTTGLGNAVASGLFFK